MWVDNTDDKPTAACKCGGLVWRLRVWGAEAYDKGTKYVDILDCEDCGLVAVNVQMAFDANLWSYAAGHEPAVQSPLIVEFEAESGTTNDLWFDKKE